MSGLFALAWSLPAGETHANLDAGTGSFLVQMLAGGIAAGAAGGAMYWNRLTALVSGPGSERTENDGGANREFRDDEG